MITITVVNQKGGVGKTTTVHALIDGLRQDGNRVLAIDLDGQRNLSLVMKANTNKATVLGVLTGELPATQAIQHTESGADIIPASSKLTILDDAIESGEELREALEEVSGNYDYCIIDTPPMLCKRTLSALIASQSVVIPAQASLFSLQGIDDLSDTIKAIQRERNKSLKVAGILLTASKERTTAFKDARDLTAQLAEGLRTTVFETSIRDSVAVSKATFFKESIFQYAPKSPAAQDYRNFIEELKERI